MSWTHPESTERKLRTSDALAIQLPSSSRGVTIGDNTVIGAGSVVTKNIPSDVIAVGVPCKVLRKITEEDKYRYPMCNG